MIIKCQSCGITYESAYGHYHCVSLPLQQQSGPAFESPSAAVAAAADVRPLEPVAVIESWDLDYNLGVAIDNIAHFALEGEDWEYLEEAVEALQREISRVKGGQR